MENTEPKLTKVTIPDVDINQLFELEKSLEDLLFEQHRYDLMPICEFLMWIVDTYGDIYARDLLQELEDED